MAREKPSRPSGDEIPWLPLFGRPIGGSGAPRTFLVIYKGEFPFLYLPTDPKLARIASNLWTPQSTSARLVVRGMNSPAGRLAPLLLPRVAAAMPEGSGFERFLQGVAGPAPFELAVLCGNPHLMGQRFVFLLLSPQGETIATVKAGHSASACRLIEAEADFIERFPSHVMGGPRLLRRFRGDEFSAFAMEFYRGIPSLPVVEHQLSRLMQEWILPQSRGPLSSLPAWSRMVAGDHPMAKRAARAVGTAAVSAVLAHGDFAPWNLRTTPEGRLVALDWERGQTNGVPAWDWFRYVVQTAVLIRKESVPQVLRTMRKHLAEPSFQDYARQTGIAGLEVPIFVGYLVHSLSLAQADHVEGINQLIRQVDELWPGWDTRVESVAPPSVPRFTFSVVTPSYNQLDWLALNVASVADQAAPLSVEHIIQDAGTGGIEDFVRHQSGAFYRANRLVFDAPAHPDGHRLEVHCESDGGMYDAINRGFARASGQFLAWLNSDEQYLPGALPKVKAFFDQHPEVDVVFGDALLVNEAGAMVAYRRTIQPNIWHTQLSHLSVLSCATFIRRSVFDRGFCLNSTLKAIADARWIVDLKRAGVKMAVLREPLAAFTLTTTNLGQSSLALIETLQWRNELRPLVRSLRQPLILHHRFRKLLAGAYGRRSLATGLYTRQSPARRTEIRSDRLPFSWPKPPSPAAATGFGGVIRARQWRLVGQGMLVAVLFSALIQWLDRHTPGVVLTPLLSISFLISFAFFRPPPSVVGAGIILAGSVLLALLNFPNALPSESPGLLWIVVRFFSFLLGVMATVMFSYSRVKANTALHETRQIMDQLPLPLVISDAVGRVIAVNQQACRFFVAAPEDLIGRKWTDLLLANRDEGTATRRYVEVFAMQDNVAKLELWPAGEPRRPIPATLFFRGAGGRRELTTVLHDSAELAGESH